MRAEKLALRRGHSVMCGLGEDSGHVVEIKWGLYFDMHDLYTP